ncbi:MAG: helix-turn-helix transcriptional regulator [Gemmatimonadaceae bacterium]|nr:helix-turn-helix transcriptional regulator [Gemmatimonadaceae bacterium]
MHDTHRDGLRYQQPATAISTTADGGTVATFLTPIEQQRVDAAGHGCYRALHRESLEDLLVDLRSRAVSAVLVSVARYQAQHAPQVARLVREFPRIPAVALVSTTEPRTTQSVLDLGHHGVRALVDTRDPRGWRELRTLVTSERPDLIEKQATQRIRDDLPNATQDCLQFFDDVFRAPAYVSTVQQIARLHGVLPSTFMSRFFRLQLPAPKQYLAMARLVRAARLLENPGLNITHVANHLEYSSAQSFSRHVRLLLHCTPAEFRQQYDGLGMLDAMREQLVIPYRDVLQRLQPFTTMPPGIPSADGP